MECEHDLPPERGDYSVFMYKTLLPEDRSLFELMSEQNLAILSLLDPTPWLCKDIEID